MLQQLCLLSAHAELLSDVSGKESGKENEEDSERLQLFRHLCPYEALLLGGEGNLMFAGGLRLVGFEGLNALTFPVGSYCCHPHSLTLLA